MTNAEKLAKDTGFMIDSIASYCHNTNCRQCRFLETKGASMRCGIVTHTTGTFRDDIKNYLEREVKEDA